jgi:hypothetical protein
MHATALVGIGLNGITRVLLVYSCQQGVYPSTPTHVFQCCKLSAADASSLNNPKVSESRLHSSVVRYRYNGGVSWYACVAVVPSSWLFSQQAYPHCRKRQSHITHCWWELSSCKRVASVWFIPLNLNVAERQEWKRKRREKQLSSLTGVRLHIVTKFFLAILHTYLTLIFIYCRYKSCLANIIALYIQGEHK